MESVVGVLDLLMAFCLRGQPTSKSIGPYKSSMTIWVYDRSKVFATLFRTDLLEKRTYNIDFFNWAMIAQEMVN